MAYIGNSPGVASQRILTTFTATAGQTTFTPSSGYTVGYLDVYHNGVKLINGDDYTASNGSTFALASGAASGDVIEAVAYLPRGLSDGYTKTEADARYMDINSVPTPAAVSDAANSSTGYFALPAGTTAQRPGSPAFGMIRANTTTGLPEWYDSDASEWKPFNVGITYAVDYLVVAGGGSGNSGYINDVNAKGGGGGAGGMLTGTTTLSKGATYSVVVGAGGAYVFLEDTSPGGSDSAFGADVTAVGGGGGGKQSRAGGNGGSGGGCGYNGTAIFGLGTTGQGNNGGPGDMTSAGGGGGKGGAGGTPTAGVGSASSISGSSVTYATGGSGGSGASGNGVAGTANTGNGGGGGGSGSSTTGSNGGSGIVIIRYAGSQRGTGGTVTSSGGYTIHTFTSSGTFTA